MKRILFIAEAFLCMLLTILTTVQPGKAQSNDNGSKPIVCTYAGATSGSSISKSKFISDSTIQSFGENADYTYRYKIISFRVSVIAKGETPVQNINSEGNKVPAKAKELIKTAPAGSKVSFEMIRAKMEVLPKSDTVPGVNYDVLRTIEPMTFIIIED